MHADGIGVDAQLVDWAFDGISGLGAKEQIDSERNPGICGAISDDRECSRLVCVRS